MLTFYEILTRIISFKKVLSAILAGSRSKLLILKLMVLVVWITDRCVV